MYWCFVWGLLPPTDSSGCKSLLMHAVCCLGGWVGIGRYTIWNILQYCDSQCEKSKSILTSKLTSQENILVMRQLDVHAPSWLRSSLLNKTLTLNPRLCCKVYYEYEIKHIVVIIHVSRSAGVGLEIAVSCIASFVCMLYTRLDVLQNITTLLRQ